MERERSPIKPKPPVACPRCRRRHVIETLRELYGLYFRCEECGFFWAISMTVDTSADDEPVAALGRP
jgi:hypothetical protein